MVRNQFQDIKKKKIIRIEQPKKENKPFRDYSSSHMSKIFEANVDDRKIQMSNRSSSPRYTLWVVALVSVVFLFFALSYFFASATITIDLKVKAISLNENMSAVKDPNAEGLSFDLVSLSDEESKTIQAGEEKSYDEKAKGRILFYNKFSTKIENIASDSKLEGSNGKIYRTLTGVTIPGMSKDGTPGKVSADIYAEVSGAEYNSEPIDFKVVSLKGTSKSSKIYGRSVGNISGGLVGVARMVSDDQKVQTENELKKNLKDKLFNKVVNQIPEGFVLFNGATSLSVDDSSTSEPGADGSVVVDVKGTLYGFILNEEKLSNKIATDIVPNYDGSSVYISNLKDLVFSISNKDNLVFGDVSNIDFNLYGVPKVVYKIDSTNLSAELAGKSKDYLGKILKDEYPNVEGAVSSIKPIWRSSFPEKPEKIKILINYPN